jgi:hypothetical protein
MAQLRGVPHWSNLGGALSFADLCRRLRGRALARQSRARGLPLSLWQQLDNHHVAIKSPVHGNLALHQNILRSQTRFWRRVIIQSCAGRVVSCTGIATLYLA